MRIIAGQYRGRRLSPLPHTSQTWLRPTSDRVKETLFQVLSHGRWVEGVGDQLLTDAVVADLACGSGNLGFEALSRGAAHLILLDQRVEALQLARKNAQQLGCDPTSLSLLLGDLTKLPPAPRPCSILFLDPPYAPPHTKGLAAAALPQLLARGWIAEAGAVVIAETGRTEALPIPAPTDAQWQLVDERLIGETRLSFITVRHSLPSAEAGA